MQIMQADGSEQMKRLIEALNKDNTNIVFVNCEHVTINQTLDSSTNQNVSSGVMVGSSVSNGTTFDAAPPKGEGGLVSKIMNKYLLAGGLLVALSFSLYEGNSPKLTNCLTQLTKIVMKE